MPYVSGPIDETSGAVVDLVVGVDEVRHGLLVKHAFPVPPVARVRAQIDTGSSMTAIDPEILRALDLRSIGRASVITPSTGINAHVCNLFVVSLALLSEDTGSHHPSVTVLESEFHPDEGIKALIGRDLLRKCLFVYDGQRQTFALAL